MRKALKEVQSGRFAKEWVEEHRSGEKQLKALMDEIAKHKIEKVGSFIRKTSGIEK